MLRCFGGIAGPWVAFRVPSLARNRAGRGARGGRQTGVTLTEAMVTVSVAAIALTQGVPSLIDFTRNARLDSQLYEAIGSLGFARSEAIMRGERVTVCPSLDGTSCRGVGIWEDGWIVFVDPEGKGAVDPGEAILRYHGPMEGGNTLRGGTNRSHISYRSSGFLGGTNDTLRLCDARGTTQARSLTISMQGRVRTQKTASRCP